MKEYEQIFSLPEIQLRSLQHYLVYQASPWLLTLQTKKEKNYNSKRNKASNIFIGEHVD